MIGFGLGRLFPPFFDVVHGGTVLFRQHLVLAFDAADRPLVYQTKSNAYSSISLEMCAFVSDLQKRTI